MSKYNNFIDFMQVCINNANQTALTQDGHPLYQLYKGRGGLPIFFTTFHEYRILKIKILSLEINKVSNKYENVFKGMIGCNQEIESLISSCSEEIYSNIKRKLMLLPFTGLR